MTDEEKLVAYRAAALTGLVTRDRLSNIESMTDTAQQYGTAMLQLDKKEGLHPKNTVEEKYGIDTVELGSIAAACFVCIKSREEGFKSEKEDEIIKELQRIMSIWRGNSTNEFYRNQIRYR